MLFRSAAARARAGWQKLAARLDPPALRKDLPDVAIDLSALCPGYASDCLGEQFEAWGVHDYLVEVGGEFRARGDGALGSGWRVGVERPTSRASDLQSPSAASGHAKDGDSKSPALALAAAVSLANQSLATSGDYRNFFVVNGRRFSHHLDPRTGWPTDSTIASVSVVHVSTMHADALGTGLTVLGFEQAQEDLRQLQSRQQALGRQQQSDRDAIAEARTALEQSSKALEQLQIGRAHV